jgi:CRISP-associated protein Cas1
MEPEPAQEKQDARKVGGGQGDCEEAARSGVTSPTPKEAARSGDGECRKGIPSGKMTPEEAQAFREKALEILRKEVPAEGREPKVEGREVGNAECGARSEDRAREKLGGKTDGVRSADCGVRSEDRTSEKLEGATEAAKAGTPNPDGTQTIPARMLNEFVYCRRLFYYEFVEGVFVESADTLRGSAIHARVDSGTGAMPIPGNGSRVRGSKFKGKVKAKGAEAAPKEDQSLVTSVATQEKETIHSRSVQMGSARLGVIAKMDLVEVTESRVEAPPSSFTNSTSEVGEALRKSGNPGPKVEEGGSGPQTEFTSELFAAYEVCPVDYKAGAPREGVDANELWDTDKMQLGLQALILRDNGYICNEGIIYYRATKQRVRLLVTAELETWIVQQIAEAREVIKQPIPAPLVNSPKCVRCSLAPVCLPDETRMLAGRSESTVETETSHSLLTAGATAERRGAETVPYRSGEAEKPRRLMAARDDRRPLYLNTPGLRVGCGDEVLTVKEKDRLIEEIRVRDVSHVALFGNIQISTQAVQTLCEMEVPITYFSMGGWFYGITRGHELKNVFLRMEQFRWAREAALCLPIARQIVHGKIRNQRTMLMRNHVEPPSPAILKLKRASEDALEAGAAEELLGIEGAAAGMYFQHFDGMIKSEEDLPEKVIETEALGTGQPESGNGEASMAKSARPELRFDFTGRNRRPPTDPVNAMLSLAYSLLMKDATLAALAVGFDPYVGFYHQPRFGRPALGLDLMEEFRPLVAESTVLSCINNRVVTEKDFVRAGEAVNLSAAGRRRFFQIYEQRMSSLITHPLFDYKVSYRRALELQARILAKTIAGEIAQYTPLLTR